MKKRWVFCIIGCLVLLLVPMVGCIEDSGSKTPATPIVTATDQQQNSRLTTIEANNTEQDKKISELTGKVAAIPAQSSVNQPAIDALNQKIAELQQWKSDSTAKILALETKVNQWTNPTPGQPQQNPPIGTPTGVVSYSITNPQQYYQFPSTGGLLAFRIFNNMNTTRYVRPQITLSTFGATSAGTMTAYSGAAIAGSPAVCVIQSSSLGQTPLGFQFMANPTGNVTSILFISNGGGAFGNGEYFLGAGQSMDVYANIGLSTSTIALWSVNISGADRPMQ